MPRKPRKLSATGIYHIMTRGIDRMAIFHDDEDREKYLEILADCLPGEQQVEDGSFVPTSCDKGTVPNPALLYNYCLMGNHVLLVPCLMGE